MKAGAKKKLHVSNLQLDATGRFAFVRDQRRHRIIGVDCAEKSVVSEQRVSLAHSTPRMWAPSSNARAYRANDKRLRVFDEEGAEIFVFVRQPTLDELR
jgi:hypothetical protein